MRTQDKAATIDDLPTELFHNVLDHVGCEHHHSIAACTLVCRRWLDISRQHLFSELHVPRGPDEGYEDLADFLETHQSIAGCVRTLNLEPRLFSMPPVESLLPTVSLAQLARLLKAMPGLLALRMRQIKVTSSANRAPPSDVSHFHLDHMEYEKCMSEMNHTFELLSWFHIDHLDFDPLFTDAEDKEIDAGDYVLDVRSLCVSPATTDPLITFQALQQVIPKDMLKSFRYPSSSIYSEPLPVVEFLREVGKNIIDLNLCPSGCDDYLVLPQLPSLQVFRYQLGISLFCPPENISHEQALLAPFKAHWLPHLPGDLDQLILYLEYGDARAAASPTSTSTALWDLELALARFTRLKKLSLIFPELPCPRLSAEAAAVACFPTAHARGILDIDVRDFVLECREWDIYGYLRDCC